MLSGDTVRTARPEHCFRLTEEFVAWERINRFQGFAKQAYTRLEILEAAKSREDLIALPSNRFESLLGDQAGQYSIRIN